MLDYKNGIHKECGKKFETYKDIIITPFYTEEFCQELVKICEFYKDKFSPYIYYYYKGVKSNNSPWNTLSFNKINYYLFEDFCDHYKKKICPLLLDVFPETKITGWFSPMIIKYDKSKQILNLHNDESLITMNLKLNNNYEGSTLYFPRQEWSNKDVPIGHAYLWPSNVTHPHRTDELKSGIKYTLTNWTFPPVWKKENFIENV